MLKPETKMLWKLNTSGRTNSKNGANCRCMITFKAAALHCNQIILEIERERESLWQLIQREDIKFTEKSLQDNWEFLQTYLLKSHTLTHQQMLWMIPGFGIRKLTSTARGSEVAIALLPSVSYISLTPRLSQIYTMTPLSNLNKTSRLID